MDSKCTCEDIIETIEELIPMLLAFLCAFIFIVLVYRGFGKNRALYWFTLTTLFLFDVATIGLSVEYLPALQHVCTCSCDDQL